MTLIDEIKNKDNILLNFFHGLGDLINFYPIFRELKKQTGKNITLCSEEKRQFHLIFPDIISNNKVDIRKYDFIKRIEYKEPEKILEPKEWNSRESKPYICALDEIGLKDFVWQQYLFDETTDKNSKRIGVSFFGITGSKEKDSKFCPEKIAEDIWKEIIESGYEPFELYQKVNFIKDYYIKDDPPDKFDFVNKNNSLRFQEPNLKTLYDEIKKCKKVISVDTGVLYLSISILGLNNVIGLENKKYISNFLPSPIKTTSVDNYNKQSIYNLLEK